MCKLSDPVLEGGHASAFSPREMLGWKVGVPLLIGREYIPMGIVSCQIWCLTIRTERNEKCAWWLIESVMRHILNTLSSCHSYPMPPGLHTMRVYTCIICVVIFPIKVRGMSTGHSSLHKVRVQTIDGCRLEGPVAAPLVFWKST